MGPILAGIETEYGLGIEGRGAENQVEDSQALVRSLSDKRFSGWDYRNESPRADLRGFRLDRLTSDPNDAKFDAGRSYGSDQEIRADQVLANGARFYNDHGHPEYATPECALLEELVLHDLAGEAVVEKAAQEYEAATGRKALIYKNNTDFHGASYGTHESYLVPRALGFEALYRHVTPMLVARQLLCGAGKVGAESGGACEFQLSQRADHLVDAASAETLYRRPVFNTRDEPHADPTQWIRLHVIAGDANMIPSATWRKVGLVKLVLALLLAGEPPEWEIHHPADAFSAVSRNPDAAIPLAGNRWTTAAEILESYLAAGEKVLGLRAGHSEPARSELFAVALDCRELLEARTECPERFRSQVDWAAKRWMLEQVMESEGWSWGELALKAYDLEYHRLPPEEGLYAALSDAGQVMVRPDRDKINSRRFGVFEPTRARARSIAVRQFADNLRSASWGRLVFEVGGRIEEIDLEPDRQYPESLEACQSVEEFIQNLRNTP